MSEPTDHGIWSADEGDLIESCDLNRSEPMDVVNFHSPIKHKKKTQHLKTHVSFDDLTIDKPFESKIAKDAQSCHSLSKSVNYDHVQSKVKKYVELVCKREDHHQNTMSSDKMSHPKEPISKEEYLEEINQMLRKELEEKNALLTQLQQNYENLLVKYAEAQNKIDNLRLEAAEEVKHHYKSVKGSGGGNQQLKVLNTKVIRPSSLSLGAVGTKCENEHMKAVTPTDSEGMSSVMTSMSGHSKIINNFEEDDSKIDAEPEPVKTHNNHSRSAVLMETSASSHVIDKVRKWQNSLPPLEMIEKPDTAFYDVVTPSTMYNDIAPQSEDLSSRNLNDDKLHFRSSALRKSQQMTESKRKMDILQTTDSRRRCKPPFFRSVSLPMSESPIGLRKNIPPLDLDSMTTSSRNISSPPSYSVSKRHAKKDSSAKENMQTDGHKDCDSCQICGVVVSPKAINPGSKSKKHPLLRSKSFNSEVASSVWSSIFEKRNDNFDAFTSHLRYRSHSALKAIAAHINSSP